MEYTTHSAAERATKTTEKAKEGFSIKAIFIVQWTFYEILTLITFLFHFGFLSSASSPSFGAIVFALHEPKTKFENINGSQVRWKKGNIRRQIFETQ